MREGSNALQGRCGVYFFRILSAQARVFHSAAHQQGVCLGSVWCNLLIPIGNKHHFGGVHWYRGCKPNAAGAAMIALQALAAACHFAVGHAGAMILLAALLVGVRRRMRELRGP